MDMAQETDQYKCPKCRRKLLRLSDLSWKRRRSPYLSCDAGGEFALCQWPRCIEADRSIGKRALDGLLAAGWWFDATASG